MIRTFPESFATGIFSMPNNFVNLRPRRDETPQGNEHLP